MSDLLQIRMPAGKNRSATENDHLTTHVPRHQCRDWRDSRYSAGHFVRLFGDQKCESGTAINASTSSAG